MEGKAKKSKPLLLEAMRLESIQRSRKMMYEEPTPDVSVAIDKARKRLRQWQPRISRASYTRKLTHKTVSPVVYTELIGELRSAESRKRLSIFQHNMEKLKHNRCQHLVDTQVNAIEAIRLKNLFKVDDVVGPMRLKFLNVIEHRRVEQLVSTPIEELISFT